jgi:NAD(P)-dependent dehydrogenase (short-subunit alcohol dehydrogenase family)
MNTTEQPVAIVTGASSGIGLGVTQALLARGWRVVTTSRTVNKSKDLKPSPDLDRWLSATVALSHPRKVIPRSRRVLPDLCGGKWPLS